MGKAPEEEDQGPAPPGICSEVLRTGIWRLWLVLAVFYTCKLPLPKMSCLNTGLCLQVLCA